MRENCKKTLKVPNNMFTLVFSIFDNTRFFYFIRRLIKLFLFFFGKVVVYGKNLDVDNIFASYTRPQNSTLYKRV